MLSIRNASSSVFASGHLIALAVGCVHVPADEKAGHRWGEFGT